MRKYTKLEENRLQEVACNKCGKKMKVENGFLKEGCFHGENVFGYFSTRDGMKHSWDMCEACYDQMVQDFAIPAEETQELEYL